MPNLIRTQMFTATQCEIVILRAFESFAEAADVAQQVGAINAEMIEVILAEKEFGIPIRLEERIDALA